MTEEKGDSPVASMSAVRALMFMGGPENEVLASGDVSTAFLKADEYAPGDKPRYVTWKEYKGAVVKVWRLKGCLYGQRDSPRRWYDTIVKYLVDEAGFTQGVNEPCLFVNSTTGMKVVIHVDDLFTCGSEEATKAFYKQMDSRFGMKEYSVLSPANPLKHVGFEITMEKDSEGSSFFMSQQDDVDQFLLDQGLEIRKQVECPMPSRESIFLKPKLLNKEGRD